MPRGGSTAGSSSSLKAKSSFTENHPLSLGVRGAPSERFLCSSDLVFSIGSSLTPGRFSHHIPNAPEKIIIQCTLDDLDINRYYPVNHAIIGDANFLLKQLISEVNNQKKPIKKELVKEMSKDAALEQSSTVFSSRAQGLGKNAVSISLFKNYREYAEYIDNLSSKWDDLIEEWASMLVDLKGPILKPFSLKYLVE